MTSQSLADALCIALGPALISPNESDRNLEPANIVDGLFAIARAIDHLAEATETQGRPMSALDYHDEPF